MLRRAHDTAASDEQKHDLRVLTRTQAAPANTTKLCTYELRQQIYILIIIHEQTEITPSDEHMGRVVNQPQYSILAKTRKSFSKTTDFV